QSNYPPCTRRAHTCHAEPDQMRSPIPQGLRTKFPAFGMKTERTSAHEEAAQRCHPGFQEDYGVTVKEWASVALWPFGSVTFTSHMRLRGAPPEGTVTVAVIPAPLTLTTTAEAVGAGPVPLR